MRDYGKVSPQFWVGRTGKALRGDSEAQLVALYLMTSPHANMIGVFHCPIAYIAHETGVTLEGALKALQRLWQMDFCTYDEDLEMVFVHEFAAHQVGDALDPKDLRWKGVKNELAKLPKGKCWQSFRARYAVPYNLPIEGQIESPIKAPCKGLASQKQEQEQEQVESKLSLASPRPLAEADPEPSKPRPGKPALPECPHLEILALWADVLPALPQHLPSQWRGARADHLRARWREKAVEKQWATQAEGLEYFRRLFAHIGKSSFLTGKTPNRDPDKRQFVIELEWLVSPGNWAKVLEGKYNEEAVAA